MASVASLAAGSRAAVLAFAAVAAWLAPPYDSSNALISRPSLGAPLSHGDELTEAALGHLANWDGAFFAYAARFGYTVELQHAFYPGLPLALAFLRCGDEA
jgi:hypothetical protein